MTEKKQFDRISKKESNEESEEKQLSSGELQQLFNQDKIKRVQSCQNEINKILQKYKCQLIGTPQYTQDGRTTVVIGIQILPN